MAHILSIEELEGKFDTLLASSSKERKRLLIRTVITANDTNVNTFLVFQTHKEQEYHYASLKEAVKKYNSIT